MLDKTSDIKHLSTGDSTRFFSATHDEIASGTTTDIYFLRTRDILRNLNLLDTPVVADVFCRQSGIFCGTEEVKRLLEPCGVDFWALPEGTLFNEGETVMRISGPYGAFGIFETALLGIAASSTAWATAASKCKAAAGDLKVVCFGARHIHPSVAPVMERSAIIGGVDGCSCVLAALLAGVSPTGTMPHAAVIIAGDTVKVATAFDEVAEEDVQRIILVDTFMDESEESLRVAHVLGNRLAGVRLDTPSELGGVTPALVADVRKRLDGEKFYHVKIAVSGGMTPDRIVELKKAGADFFGVGSFISSARPIEMTMDIKEVNGKSVAKRGRVPGISKSDKLVKIL